MNSIDDHEHDHNHSHNHIDNYNLSEHRRKMRNKITLRETQMLSCSVDTILRKNKNDVL